MNDSLRRALPSLRAVRAIVLLGTAIGIAAVFGLVMAYKFIADERARELWSWQTRLGVAVDGHRLVSHWDQVLGEKPGGGQWIVPGISILYYAGDGLFCYSHDYLNMTYIGETMKAMAWKPPPGFNMPPRKPNWSTELPAAWRSLPTAFANDESHHA